MKDTDKVTLTIGQLKKLISESIVDDDVITIPEDLMSNEKWQEEFMGWADEHFDGDVYNSLVSDDEEEVEGTQRDVDSFDVYRYSEQQAIDYDAFWDKLLQAISDDFTPNEKVNADDMINYITKTGRKIAEYAFENYEVDDEDLIYRGSFGGW